MQEPPLSVSGFQLHGRWTGTPSGCASKGSNSIFLTITSAGGGASGNSTPSSTFQLTLQVDQVQVHQVTIFQPPKPPGTAHQIGGSGNTPPGLLLKEMQVEEVTVLMEHRTMVLVAEVVQVQVQQTQV